MTPANHHAEYSRWPHLLAMVLACATFPLIWVGGLVTTYDAGMAVPDWPTTYGYNMFLYPLSTWWSGPWDLFIEHGHRLLGSLVGLVTIGLNVAIWRCDSRKWMKWVGLAAFVLVVAQGVLGGMRVRLASMDLARLHGCTGPLFFALVVAICVMTSRYWFASRSASSGQTISRRALAAGIVLTVLAYLQLVLGAHLRHPDITWSPTQFRVIVVFHVLTAVVLAWQAISIAIRARKYPAALSRPAFLLALLVVGQVFLGVATWRAKYGWPTFVPIVAESKADRPIEISIHRSLVGGTVLTESMSQALTVTAHVAMGSLILVVSVLYVTRFGREYARCPSAQAKARTSNEQTSACAVSPFVAGGAIS